MASSAQELALGSREPHAKERVSSEMIFVVSLCGASLQLSGARTKMSHVKHPSTPIEIARAYDLPSSDASYRVLVDRLWPRGVKKESLHIDQWAKELSPSTGLRKWFGHDPDKWDGFQKRFLDELSEKSEQIDSLLQAAGEKPILLIYAAKDEEHNNAVVLKKALTQFEASSPQSSEVV